MTTRTRLFRDCVCADCGRTRQHHGRGLCNTCWIRHHTAGTLDRFPRTLRRRVDVIEDWEELRGQGYTRRDAAARMGMTLDALNKAIERDNAARRAGEAIAS